MAYPSKIVDRAEVRRWILEGKTYREMADIYQERHEQGVPGYDIMTNGHIQDRYITPATFSNFRQEQGLPYRHALTPLQMLKPWKVLRKHRGKGPDVHINYLARMMEGLPVPPDRKKSTDSFWKMMQEQNLVITYTPELGYFAVPRREGIDGVYIRKPDPVED